MPTYIENLVTARDNLARKLVEISANPKPSYDIDGQRIEWNDYFRMLTDALEELDKLKQRHGPVYIRWLGRTIDVVDIEINAL